LSRALADIVITTLDGTEEIECQGTYCGDGRVLISYNGDTLMIDPSWYFRKDPKRLFIIGDQPKWSNYRIKQIVLDSREIIKQAKILVD
jgi:hypothetical protein